MRLLEFFANGILHYRALVVSCLVAVSLVATWGHLRETSPRQIKRLRADPEKRLNKDVEHQFELDEPECFLVIDVEDLFTPHTTAAVRAVVDAVEGLEQVEKVTWIDDVPTLNAFGLPEPLLPDNRADRAAFAAARRRTIEHPLVHGQLLSPDAKTLLLPLSFQWISYGGDRGVSTQLLDVARRAAADYPEAKLRIQMTGRFPVYLAARQAFNNNHLKFQLIGYVLVFVLAALLFRGISAVLIVGVAPALAIYWTQGLLKLLAVPQNELASVVLPVLIVMVGLTDGVHLMVFIRRRRASGDAPTEAVRSAVRHVGTACMLTSLTTAIGFASLLLAKSEPIRDFGVACSLGVLVTFFAVVIFIPLVCSTRIGRGIHRGYEHDLVGRNLEKMGGLIDWLITHARPVSIAGAILTLVCGVTSLTLKPDAQTTNSLPTGSPATDALMHVNDAFGGIEHVRVVVEWPETLARDDSQILAVVEDVAANVAAEPLLRHPLSIHNLLAAMPGSDKQLAGRMPFLDLLPEGLGDAFYNRTARRTLVVFRVQDLGIAAYQPVFERVESNLDRLEGKYPGFQLELTGDPVLAGRDLSQIVVDLATSLGTASIVILIVMTLFYRSLRIGLITVIPNILPLAITGAMLVVTGETLAIVSVCAFTVCIGIAVDDTIHFLTRFRQELPLDNDVSAAIRRTFIGVGSALVMTTMILLTGFGTVLISPLPTHRMFSTMACCTIGAALIGDLIFLPALLSWLIRSSGDVPPEAAAPD